jgi:hypothetical protein
VSHNTHANRIPQAIALAFVSFLVFMVVGEGIQSSRRASGIPETVYRDELVLGAVIGAYFALSGFLLGVKNPRPIWTKWKTLLALNSLLFIVAIVALVGEPNTGAALQTLAASIIGILCSMGGFAFATFIARRKAVDNLG